MPDVTFRQSNYLPTLDGWRAVSIALVILHHSRVECAVPFLGAGLRAIADAGEVGVELFFAISGLLICTRLLDEESKTGTLSIKGFYQRRFFRILPAALLYLFTIAMLAGLHVIPLSPRDWFAALLFFRNYTMLFAYLHHSPLPLHWYTGHFWSLSMEEHFYLLLPAIVLLCRKTRLQVLCGLAATVALWRLFLAHGLHRDYQFGFRTDTHLDALLIPAIIALMLYPVTRNERARRWLPAWSFLLFLALELILLACPVPFAFTLQAIILPLLILSTVFNPRAMPGLFLEWRPLRWLGWISYSLYLWQQLFFGVNLVGSPAGMVRLRTAPANYLALMACAMFGYYVVEKPCIRLGHKWMLAAAARRGDPGHVDAAKNSETCKPLPPKGRIHTAS